MSFAYMLTDAIRETFLKEVGKFAGKAESPKAMLLRCRISLRGDEEGYRERQLLIYAPMNYVGVYERETWDVIPREHLEYDEESDEEYPKKGFDYVKGASDWVLKSYHDSGWSDAIGNFLRAYERELNGWTGGSWFTVVEVKNYTLPER